jgi:hypothetical protein
MASIFSPPLLRSESGNYSFRVCPSVCPSFCLAVRLFVDSFLWTAWSQHLSRYRLDILDIARMGPSQDWYCKRATYNQEKWLNWTSKVRASFQYYNGFVNRLKTTSARCSQSLWVSAGAAAASRSLVLQGTPSSHRPIVRSQRTHLVRRYRLNLSTEKYFGIRLCTVLRVTN